MSGTKWFGGGRSYSWIGGTKGDSRSFVMRDVLLVDQAKLDCLEGGTHEETLRPQVNPKVECSKVQRSRGLKPIAQGSKNTLDCVERE